MPFLCHYLTVRNTYLVVDGEEEEEGECRLRDHGQQGLVQPVHVRHGPQLGHAAPVQKLDIIHHSLTLH